MIRSDFETILAAREALRRGDVAAAQAALDETVESHYAVRQVAAVERLARRHPADRRSVVHHDDGTVSVELFDVRGRKSRAALVQVDGSVVDA